LDKSNSCHYVYVPKRPRGKLLLFLSGNGCTADMYTRFMSIAAVHGYTVLGLDYYNNVPMDLCLPSGCAAVANGTLKEGDCYAGHLEEQIFGTDSSPCIAVPSDESVLSRLKTALTYLQTQLPTAGFDQYANGANGEPDWTRIAVAGHSLGGAV